MTEQQPQGPPPFDPVHPQVGMVPAWLNTGRMRGPGGDLFIMTVRVANATLTAVMGKADAQKWIDQMQTEVDGMSSLTIAPANAQMPPMSQNSNGKPFG